MIPAPRKLALRSLMTTTAMGAALMAAAPALAADECGAPVGGVVTCAASGGPYGPISYTGVSDATINIEAGAEAGPVTLTGTGPLAVVAGEGSSVSASGANVRGIAADSADGSVNVIADLVGATGANAIGISATGAGDVDVQARSVNVSGQGSTGIYAYSDGDGGVRVKAGTIEQASDSSSGYGVFAGVWDWTKSVDVEVESVSVRQVTPTVSNGVIGLFLYSGGEINVKAGSVAASGFDARGVAFYGGGDIVANIGKVTVEGQYSRGVTFGGVYANPGYFNTINATIDEIDIGAGGIGVRIYGGGRDDTVEWANNLSIGRITGEGSGIEADMRWVGNLRLQSEVIDVAGLGIRVLGTENRTLIESGSITTSGIESRGISFSGVDAELLIRSASVSTSGDRATGIFVEFSGAETRDSSVLSGSITTSGHEAIGLHVRSYDENTLALLALTSQAISTSGLGSHGVWADYAGALSLVAEDIETTGDDAIGVLVTSGDEVSLDLNRVITRGENADAVVLAGSTGEYFLKANQVTTAGDDARGVVLGAGDASRMTAELGSVTTSGDFAAAVTTSFDGLSGNSDAIILKAGALTTSGYGSNGMYLYADDMTLDVDTITTTGDSSTGAFLNAYGGDEETVALRGSIGAVQTTGAEASGVIVQSSGLFDLAIGSIHTRGAQATGFRAYSSADVGGTLTLGSVLTEGEDAHGVRLYSELGSHDIEIQSLETRGDGSVGIEMSSWGDTTLALGTVRTSGQAAAAVKSWVHGDGAFSLTAQDVRTSGGGSTGIDVFAEGALTLALGAVEVTGSETDAVRAAGSSDVTLTVGRGLSSVSGVAADLEGESIDVTLASTAVVEGGTAGLLLLADSSSVIRNAGSISSATGFAIEAEAGQVTLDNSGLITGRVGFSGADDVVNNTGRFAAALTSNFGGGNDVFNNTGVLSLADVTATSPRTALFNNLERLNNAGVIDLTNGVAGDVFGVSGIVNGQTDGTILLDLNLLAAAPTADRIVAGGFEGTSQIVLAVRGETSLNDTGIVIAESAIAQTGAEMQVRVAGGGFVGYGVTFADGAYRLDAKLVVPAFEPTKVASGAQHQWTSGADVVSARFDQMRDEDARDARGVQVWSQIFGGSNDIEARRTFELSGETTAADLSHEVKSQGVQAGVDRAVPVENGALVFGMLAGAGKTELRFLNGDVTEYDGVGVGAYGHWFSGPLSVGVLAKLDAFKLDYDWADANLKTRSDGFTVGARVDAAWRIAMGPNWHVEPQASLSWSDTALGRMAARDGAEVVFGDTRSVIGRIGVRAGAEMAVGNGLSLKPFAAVHALNEFDGDNVSTLKLVDDAVSVADRAHGAWGRAVLGASLDAPSGLGGFIQAEGDFGEVEGFTARAGVKFSW